jgi:nucleotide sugar dehydrogenase
MQPGCLVVLESTTYPGTTEELVGPLLEEVSGLVPGIGFSLGFSPERIDPGNQVYGFRNTPKIVGGLTSDCLSRIADFYRTMVDEVVLARGTREAEAAKLLENTYRHVNIALVNEMAKSFHEMDIDIWDVIRLASTKPFGFQAFYPGPGVGGHCIPIDPKYLSYRMETELGYPFRFVELAQEINKSMPAYVVQRAQGLLNDAFKSVRGATVLLLGVTYKADIADQRESPAVGVATNLLRLGARVQFHDPYVSAWSVRDAERVSDLEASVRQADLTILLQRHLTYDLQRLPELATVFLDTRGGVDPGVGHRL